ncbi:MAG: sugar transferase [Bacteroidetes bacterium]|nr:sugar transferase [Bacteroidota bacterium]
MIGLSIFYLSITTPSITSPATLKYSNEEKLLAEVGNPKKYNDEVIFPDKVKINLEYMDNWSLWKDIKMIFKTIFRSNY